jgi:hypothetical protein
VKKILLLTVALLVVAIAAVALYFHSSPRKLLALMLRPGHAYDAVPAPPAPDYDDPRAWAALPDRKDYADWVPKGHTPGDQQATAPVDVFFIHPTTYYSSAHWNAPLDDPQAEEMTAVTMVGQAAAFNRCCRVYAPRYRQATMGAYFGHDADSLAAYRLAYQDVAAAFRHFIEHFNQGRPFILASQSQGTQHGLRLLEEEIAGSPLGERLVAAYLVGYRPAVKMLKERLGSVPICETPRQTGCLVGWDTFSEEGDPSYELPFRYWAGDEVVASTGGERLCVNPISWQLGDAPAPREQHLGGAPTKTREPFPPFSDIMLNDGPVGIELTGLGAPQPGLITARCANGRLLVPPQPPPFKPMNPGGSYHIFDYRFFFVDIRANAAARAEAFLAARAPEKTPAPAE